MTGDVYSDRVDRGNRGYGRGSFSEGAEIPEAKEERESVCMYAYVCDRQPNFLYSLEGVWLFL